MKARTSRRRASILDVSACLLATTCGDNIGGTIGAHPSVTVTSPIGGETLVVGGPLVVTWTSQGVEGTVDIEYSTDGGVTWAGADIERSSNRHPVSVEDSSTGLRVVLDP